jgi:hypothetical protein
MRGDDAIGAALHESPQTYCVFPAVACGAGEVPYNIMTYNVILTAQAIFVTACQFGPSVKRGATMHGVRYGTLLSGLLLSLLLSSAQAQQPTPAQSDAIRQSCRSDFMANCGGVQPGGKEALDCLKQHVAALSAPCKSAVSAVMPAPPPAAPRPPAPAAAAPPKPAPAAEVPPPIHPLIDAAVMLRACKLDLVRHCTGVQPGGGRELACLVAHADGLTIRCRAALTVAGPLR